MSINTFMRAGAPYWDFRIKGHGRFKQRAVDPENPAIKAETEEMAYAYAVVARRRVLAGQPVIAEPAATPTEPVQRLTLQQFVDEKYIPWFKATKRWRYLPTEAKLLLEMFGASLLAEITQFEAVRFRTAIKQRVEAGQWNGRTANKRLVRAQAIFTQAIRAGLYDLANPFAQLAPFAVETVKKMALTPDEEAALLRAALASSRRAHIAHWIGCVVETGAREEEFLRLKKSEVFLGYDPWLVNRFHGAVQPPAVVFTSYKQGRKNAGEPRLRAVPISRHALPHFKALLATEGELLWPYGDPRAAWETCRTIAAEQFPRLANAGIGCLRHTFRTRVEATPLAARPTDAGEVMGHAPRIAQQHYVTTDLEAARAAINTIREPKNKQTEPVSFWSHQQKRQA